jgi:hypothetical protein
MKFKILYVDLKKKLVREESGKEMFWKLANYAAGKQISWRFANYAILCRDNSSASTTSTRRPTLS